MDNRSDAMVSGIQENSTSNLDWDTVCPADALTASTQPL